ncbi:hypothetical protein Ahy_A09g045233 [Arachis hypogaea]|uniref:Transmembrane protein n=1 Tax=Arachis hypogaea TaxID=3818 RepID=A0A445BLW2_ARAHY|nr:hypothetical protein Ahy_A09g045233 [Arachis hypogaea]
MDHTISRERDIDFDLESGGNSTEEDSSTDRSTSDGDSNGGFRYPWNRILGFESSSCSNSSTKPVNGVDNVGVLVNDDNYNNFAHVNNQNANKAATNPSRKPSKPPLPPNGPSLIAGDQRFVKELSELALRKRARIKRMKAVRKMKAIKSASSSSSSYTGFSALVISVFFLLVLIFHGIRSVHSNVVELTASPETVTPTDEDIISVQYPKNSIINEGGGVNLYDGNGGGSKQRKVMMVVVESY